ncbi:hypothetical protein DFH06DRAFT_42859 [Mycena polygramma]|nr:hypothetical protein DFH06DRAFT_42859 [Mycena polygramma]
MAPSSKVLTPAQIAAGVCIRPRCQARLTEVKKCTGFREPRNKDRFYQECSDNRHNESSCDGFYWRNDLSTPTYVLGPNDCQEPACAGVAGSARPNKKNGLCVRGACLGCCQAAAAAAPDGVTCKVSSHKLRARVPSAPSGSTSLAAPATPIRTDYSQPLTPTYYAKLISGGDNNLALSGPGSASSNAQKSRYRVEEQHSIQVLYYTQNDLSPVSFTVFCPDYPHFRPSQDKAMVSVLGLAACEVFAAYSSQLNAWSITSSAQQVNVGRVLRLRSTTVTRCQELDVLPVLKRERSGTQSEGSPSPARRKRTNGDVFTDEGDALAGDHNNSVSNSVRAVSPATSVIRYVPTSAPSVKERPHLHIVSTAPSLMNQCRTASSHCKTHLLGLAAGLFCTYSIWQSVSVRWSDFNK